MYKLKKCDMIGYLAVTYVEINSRNRAYRWRSCLAFLDSYGNWIYSYYWRSNGHRKAISELLALGWDLVD